MILGGAVFSAERFVQSDAFGQDIELAIRRELGVSGSVGRAELRWLPPRIVVARPLLELREEMQLLLPVTTIELRLAPFSGVVVEAFRVAAAGPAEIRVGGKVMRASVKLAVDRVPGSDRTLLSLSGILEAGGQVAATVELGSPGGRAALRLTAVEVAPLYALAVGMPIVRDAGGRDELAGRFSGTLEFGGSATSGIGTLLLTSDEARIRLGRVRLTGPVELRVSLDFSKPEWQGDFSIDATGARVGYGGDLHRVSGVGATLGGRIVTDSHGHLSVEALHVSLQQLDGELRLATPGTGDPAHVR